MNNIKLKTTKRLWTYTPGNCRCIK